MFLGEFHCTTDGNGRLIIPIEFRAKLAEGLIVTRGIERCLFIYPAEEWLKLAKKMRLRLPLTSRDARAFARLIFAGALVCVPDQQGRVPLPNNLRQYAGIEDQAIVVGLYTHLEIWSPRRWQEVVAQMVKEGAAVAESLSHLGI
jgi:MraZ protein